MLNLLNRQMHALGRWRLRFGYGSCGLMSTSNRLKSVYSSWRVEFPLSWHAASYRKLTQRD